MASTTAGLSRLGEQLRCEWEERADQPERAVLGWIDEPALAGCRTPAEVLAEVRAAPDAVLARLIRASARIDGPSGIETRTGNAGEAQLAALIVLRAMLPKMIRMAARDPRASLDDYLTQLWLRIRSYPLRRRPRKIAANLALDTLKAVRAERGPDDPLDRLGAGLPGWLTGTVPGPERTAAEVVASASELGLIDPLTRVILLEVYAEGRSGREVADRLQVSPTTVRFRCSRAVRRMAGRATELAA